MLPREAERPCHCIILDYVSLKKSCCTAGRNYISIDLALKSWEILTQGCCRTNAHMTEAQSDDLCRSPNAVSSGARLP